MAVEQVIRSIQERLRTEDAGPQAAERRKLLRQLAQQVRQRLAETTELDPRSPDAMETARRLVQRFLAEEESLRPLLVLSAGERAEVEDRVLSTMFGFGILTPFVRDEAITEIMVNGLDRIFIEQKGSMVRVQDREGQPSGLQ